MQIKLNKVSKRYRFEWIIKKLTCEFESNQSYVILGPNGSGKSTLMQMLSGYLTPSKGKVSFSENGKDIQIENIFKKISYAAPYIDLIEELTLDEAIKFHQRFKPFYNDITSEQIHELLAFKKSKHKEVKFFSSGMKQRLKLVLAFASDTPILLLDEPTTNLDAQGVDWYLSLVEKFKSNRLIIVASNIEHDYSFCKTELNILDYK
ncbi:MAG: ABC transporter ATP-binding protein [Saprospiraceae bacterium]